MKDDVNTEELKEAAREAYRRLQSELDRKIDDLHQQIDDRDRRLKELGQLSAGVAKKSSAGDVEKAMRIYMNMSKRKTQSKREAAKTVLLELITAAKLEMPEDFMETLSHFDDEELTDQSQSPCSVNENVADDGDSE
jgi:hypothetical protein